MREKSCNVLPSNIMRNAHTELSYTYSSPSLTGNLCDWQESAQAGEMLHALNVLWLDNNVALAVDQLFGQVVPLFLQPDPATSVSFSNPFTGKTFYLFLPNVLG